MTNELKTSEIPQKGFQRKQNQKSNGRKTNWAPYF